MAAQLPGTLGRYFEGQNALDAAAMADCFTPDAEVRDEGRTYVGRNAIREWKAATIAKYAVRAEPLSSRQDKDRVTVVAKVSGNFPGSPAELTYGFALDSDGRIQRLEIH